MFFLKIKLVKVIGFRRWGLGGGWGWEFDDIFSGGGGGGGGGGGSPMT